MFHFSVYYSYRQEPPLEQNTPTRMYHFNNKLKLLLLFPNDRMLLQKTENYLAETSSRSSPREPNSKLPLDFIVVQNCRRKDY